MTLFASLARCEADPSVEPELEAAEFDRLRDLLFAVPTRNRCQQRMLLSLVDPAWLVAQDKARFPVLVEALGVDLVSVLDRARLEFPECAPELVRRLLEEALPDPVAFPVCQRLAFETLAGDVALSATLTAFDRVRTLDGVLRYQNSLSNWDAYAAPDESWLRPALNGLGESSSTLAYMESLQVLRRLAARCDDSPAGEILASEAITAASARWQELDFDSSARALAALSAIGESKATSDLIESLEGLYQHPDARIRGGAYLAAARLASRSADAARQPAIAALVSAVLSETKTSAAANALLGVRICDPDYESTLHALRSSLQDERLKGRIDAVLSGELQPP